MYGTLIYMSSLGHANIVSEFDNVLAKKKYACFYSSEIEKVLNAGSNASHHYLLAMPFNKQLHWFLARETSNNGDTVDLDILDRHVLDGEPVSKVITMQVNKKGLLDNTTYDFFGDVDRHDSDLKIIRGIRKNSMGDYSFSFSHENVYMITPLKSHAVFE
ncbi:MAG: hypothetical protein ACE3L7_00200 [Candidatus Pristimantibacillus sp.]